MMTNQSSDLFGPDFKAEIKALVEKWQIPTAAIVYIIDGQEPVYNIVQSNSLPNGGITPQTKFPISSLTKVVSALALGQALRDSECMAGFDTLVKDILPEFKLSDETATNQCTIKDLLTHQCNFRSYDLLFTRPLTNGETVLEKVAHIPFSGPFRAAYIYNNTAVSLVYDIVEKLTGKPFERYVQRNILIPLGITSGTFSAAEAGDDLAMGSQPRLGLGTERPKVMNIPHGWDELGPEVTVASMRLILSPQDLGVLVASLEKSPLWKDFSTTYGIPTAPSKGQVIGPANRGLSTEIHDFDGLVSIGHTGASPGFRSHMMRLPELKISIGVFTNGTEGVPLGWCIQSWLVSKMSLGRSTLFDRCVKEASEGQDAWYQNVLREFPAIKSVDDSKVLGTFASPAFGTWQFDENSNFPIRPECISIPWLPHCFGTTRPVVTSVGAGTFEGCLEWIPNEKQDEGWGPVCYGYPFTLELEEDRILVRGLSDYYDPQAKKEDPPAVFYKR